MKNLILPFILLGSFSSLAQEKQYICPNEGHNLIENALIERGFDDITIKCIDSSSNPLVFVGDAINNGRKTVKVDFSQNSYGKIETEWTCLIGISNNKVESITDCSGEIQDRYFNN